MDFELEDLKRIYNEYEKKYGIPRYKELNEDFEIDKIDRESDSFLRVVRKVMMEKVVNSLNFLDMLLNPGNAPRIYYGFLKSIKEEDTKMIDEIYTKLGNLSMESLALEIDYSEKKEAEMIVKVFREWDSVKVNFRKLMEHIQHPTREEKKERNYYG